MSDDCEVCKPPPIPPHEGPGERVPMPGTRHRTECPLLPFASVEADEQLKEDLARIAENRREAIRKSPNIFIG